MAHDPGPCGPQFEDWEDAYENFQNKDAEADTRFGAAMGVTAVGAGVCAATWWTGIGLIGCAAAVGGAVVNDGVSVRASLAREEAREKLHEAKKKYHDCTAQHKWYYGERQ
jgi:hypothetical protein